MHWKEFHKEQKIVIENKISEYIDELEEDGILKEAMLYSLNAGGKRLRPFLSILVANLLLADVEKVFPFAIALEMVHTYSLIHDDLPALDDDDLRRGKPSSHKAFGEDIAILAGDALLNDAFRLILKYSTEKSFKGAFYLAESSGGSGMVLGQVLDCKIPEDKRDLKTLDNINLQKTGRMIMASTAGTALWCGADEKTVKILEDYGKNIGLAFQIADDILDIVADEKLLGKPVGSDSKLNKATYPSILGLDEAKFRAKQFIKEAKNNLKQLPQNEFTQMLSDFSDYIVERTF